MVKLSDTEMSYNGSQCVFNMTRIAWASGGKFSSKDLVPLRNDLFHLHCMNFMSMIKLPID